MSLSSTGETNNASISTMSSSSTTTTTAPREFSVASPGWRLSPSTLLHNCGTKMTNTRPFQMLVEAAFDVCDDTGDGAIDEAELYAGLLLVHLKLAKHAGPAACFPPTREVCDHLFYDADVDHNGVLDKDQFRWIMKILCAQILSRMLIFYVMMVLGVPLLGSAAVSLLGVPEGTYLEQAIRVGISVGTFFLLIPVMWNAVDDCSENQKNVSETIGASESSEALPVPSKREEQRQRRRLRRNRTSEHECDPLL